MKIRTVYPRPRFRTSEPCEEHEKFPYLLRGLKIVRPNQVWATDITYTAVEGGRAFVIAIIDLYSRYVVNWSISNTMSAQWCKETLEQAIELHGKPDIINTDQGSQFTSEIFAHYVVSQDIKLSMDGKGRAIDNAFIERLWRSVKYEKIYLNPPTDGVNLYDKK